MTTQADLAAYVGVKTGDDGYAFVAPALATAEQLLSDYVGFSVVPGAVMDQAVLTVGAELFYQRKAPSGISQFADYQGTGIRVARDPMIGAYPLLSRYVAGGFA